MDEIKQQQIINSSINSLGNGIATDMKNEADYNEVAKDVGDDFEVTRVVMNQHTTESVDEGFAVLFGLLFARFFRLWLHPFSTNDRSPREKLIFRILNALITTVITIGWIVAIIAVVNVFND